MPSSHHDVHPPVRLERVRPLVRYVDGEQAVLEVQVRLHRPLEISGETVSDSHAQPDVDLLLEIRGEDGFRDEAWYKLPPNSGKKDPSPLWMSVVQPERWWPAGMGGQTLYQVTVSLLLDQLVVDQWDTTVGLTSVRAGVPGDDCPPLLLVNGKEKAIDSVVMVDRIDERRMLPVSADSILLVRDHYGPDVLYQAADRAGILLIQCVPIDAQGVPEQEMAREVLRLAHHPCLAGWYVGHLGGMARDVAQRVRKLDPTHCIFRQFARTQRFSAA
ncbi:MAG: hypothetical protein IT441_03295 [Phycisphaeraceae bacterium]|nr:hypothetical protein [Phycisphaeraceae bacterium]